MICRTNLKSTHINISSNNGTTHNKTNKVKVKSSNKKGGKSSKKTNRKDQYQLPKLKRKRSCAGKLKMLMRAPAKLAFVMFVIIFSALVFFEVIELEHEIILKGYSRFQIRWQRFKRRLGFVKPIKKGSIKPGKNSHFQVSYDKEILAKQMPIEAKNQNQNQKTEEDEDFDKNGDIVIKSNLNKIKPDVTDDTVCDNPDFGPLDGYKNDKYLLALPFFDVGPNNLYRLFKETIPLAADLERTLIVPPFHRHPRMEADIDPEKDKNVPKARVPIFDQDYVVQVEMDPDRTIDFNCLNKKLPLLPYSEYKKICRNNIDLVIECGDVDIKRRKGIKYFTGATGLKVKKADTIQNIDNPVQIKALLKKIENYKCISVALGRKCVGERVDWFYKWKEFAPFVQRPAKIRNLTKAFLKIQFNNQPHLAMHWRYDPYDWNDMCKSSRPDAAKLTNAEICHFVDQMVQSAKNDDDLIKKIGKNVQSFMEKMNLKNAYLTGPPGLNSTFQGIKAHVGTDGSDFQFYTIEDIKKWANQASNKKSLAAPPYNLNQKDIDEIFDTNYEASLLEQELCVRSEKFLAAPLSSWSQTVMLDRAVLFDWDQMGQFDESILSVLVPDLEHVPALIWLFPEGRTQKEMEIGKKDDQFGVKLNFGPKL